MLDKINLLSMCVCVLLLWWIKRTDTQSPAFRSPLESPANLQSENQQDKKKRKKNPQGHEKNMETPQRSELEKKTEPPA